MGDELDLVASQVQQVHAAAAVFGVHLPRDGSPRLGATLDPVLVELCLDAAEVVAINQDPVVLRREVEGRFGEWQHAPDCQSDAGERAPNLEGAGFTSMLKWLKNAHGVCQ